LLNEEEMAATELLDERGRPQDFCEGHAQSEIAHVVERIAQEHARAQAEHAEWHPQRPGPARVDDLVMADWMGPEGFDFLGAGAERVVVGLCLEHALKIDFGTESGFVSSRNELAVWEQADAELRTMLCPIFDHGEVQGVPWLLMGRTWPLAEMEESERDALEAAVNPKWDRLEGIQDLRSENWGEYRGRLVITDYGESRPEDVHLASEVMGL
jgi:hypothetical protein